MATVEQPAPQTVPPPGLVPQPGSGSQSAPTSIVAASRLVLHNISWETYEALRANSVNWKVRMTFDRGRLEMMTPSFRHELYSRTIHDLIALAAQELRIPICSAGSTTWKRSDVAAGIEPDECYYIQHEQAVRGRTEIDLATDPPPDLAIEIEVSRDAGGRTPLYARLGVPEVWHYDGLTLQVWKLASTGEYVESAQSECLALLPINDIARLIDERHQTDQLSWTDSVRAWLRELIAKSQGKD